MKTVVDMIGNSPSMAGFLEYVRGTAYFKARIEQGASENEILAVFTHEGQDYVKDGHISTILAAWVNGMEYGVKAMEKPVDCQFHFVTEIHDVCFDDDSRMVIKYSHPDWNKLQQAFPAELSMLNLTIQSLYEDEIVGRALIAKTVDDIRVIFQRETTAFLERYPHIKHFVDEMNKEG